MKREIDEPLGYLQKLRPIYVRLFRLAHAIVGNVELSEYVLRSAIVEAYLRRKEWQGRMGFGEGLEHTVRGVALVELRRMRTAGAFETDWQMPGYVPPDDPMAQGLWAKLMRESEATQRIAMLYYGCQLLPRQIAQVMLIHLGDVNGRLRRLNSRLSRGARHGQKGQRALEDRLERLLVAALAVPGEDVPEAGAVFRSFERDVDGASKPRASAARVVGTVVKVAGAILLAGAFWLLAVLLQPAPAQPTVPDAQVQTEIATQT